MFRCPLDHWKNCHSPLLHMAQIGTLGGTYRRQTSQQFRPSESGIFRGQMTAAFQGCVWGVPAVGARLHPITSVWLPARRASSLLLAPHPESDSFYGWNPVRRLFSQNSHPKGHISKAGEGRWFLLGNSGPIPSSYCIEWGESGVRKMRRNTTAHAPSPADRAVSC